MARSRSTLLSYLKEEATVPGKATYHKHDGYYWHPASRKHSSQPSQLVPATPPVEPAPVPSGQSVSIGRQGPAADVHRRRVLLERIESRTKNGTLSAKYLSGAPYLATDVLERIASSEEYRPL